MLDAQPRADARRLARIVLVGAAVRPRSRLRRNDARAGDGTRAEPRRPAFTDAGALRRAARGAGQLRSSTCSRPTPGGPSRNRDHPRRPRPAPAVQRESSARRTRPACSSSSAARASQQPSRDSPAFVARAGHRRLQRNRRGRRFSSRRQGARFAARRAALLLRRGGRDGRARLRLTTVAPEQQVPGDTDRRRSAPAERLGRRFARLAGHRGPRVVWSDGVPIPPAGGRRWRVRAALQRGSAHGCRRSARGMNSGVEDAKSRLAARPSAQPPPDDVSAGERRPAALEASRGVQRRSLAGADALHRLAQYKRPRSGAAAWTWRQARRAGPGAAAAGAEESGRSRTAFWTTRSGRGRARPAGRLRLHPVVGSGRDPRRAQAGRAIPIGDPCATMIAIRPPSAASTACWPN